MIPTKRDKSRMCLWLAELKKRSHPRVALIPLANKVASICRRVFAIGSDYQPFPSRHSEV
jgi:hypothetical protein